MREVHLRRTGRDLLSRTADNLFWLGRYAERAEGTMRLLRSVLSRFSRMAGPSQSPALLQRLLDCCCARAPAAPDPKREPARWHGVEAARAP